MATKKTKKVVIPETFTEEDITSATQLARAKMKNVKKSIQEEGKADIIAFNERFKAYKQPVPEAWKQ